MQKQKENLSTSMPKLIMIVSLIVCIGALAGVISWLAEKNQPGTTQPPVISAKCEEGCFLAYTAGGCAACDLANENWKCVSSEENQRINKMRQKYDQGPNGPQCALCMPEQSLVEFRCVCENGNCIKTSACESDADCSSPVGGKWFGDKYKCVNNQCRIDQSNQGSSQLSNADTSDWKTYRNEKLGITFEYPKSFEVTKEDFVDIGFSDKYRQKHLAECDKNPECIDTTLNIAMMKEKTLEDYRDEYSNFDDSVLVKIVKTGFIDGQKAKLGYMPAMISTIFVAIEYPSKGVIFIYSTGPSVYIPSEENFNQDFNQILSTFKFIEK